jgi:hypothetical protein
MAIDTEEKRYASLTFGHCLNAGTRIPSGTSTAARRGAALGLYVIESAAVTAPNEGWISESRSRVMITTDRSRVMIPKNRERVWIAEAK